jgi:hypothetical protein
MFAGRQYGAIKPIANRGIETHYNHRRGAPSGCSSERQQKLGSKSRQAWPDRNVAGQIGRGIVDAGGPARGESRNGVAGPPGDLLKVCALLSLAVSN